jgi:hypothetical protein
MIRSTKHRLAQQWVQYPSLLIKKTNFCPKTQLVKKKKLEKTYPQKSPFFWWGEGRQ